MTTSHKAPDGGSTIVRFEAANIKRIRAVTITPDGNIVTIRGRNAQGKTSVLDAIEMVLGGKDAIPERPVRDGETTARIVVETQDLIAERKWTTPENSYLEVRSHAGAKFPSPQKKLDEYIGALSFDPLGFMRMDQKTKAETVRKLLGLDFSREDAERKRLFDERTAVNRDAAALAARIGPAVPKVEPIDVKETLAEVDRLTDAKATLVAENAKRIRLEHEFDEAEEEVARLQEELKQAAEKLANASAALQIANDAAPVSYDGELNTAAAMLQVARSRLSEAESINTKARAYTARAALEAQHKATEAKALALSEAINTIDKEKAKRLQETAFPVDGMAFLGDILAFRGVPIEQASGAEQLIVSVKMGLALNPKLRVLLVRDASLLDVDSLKVVATIAAEAGAQVWLEMVGKDGAGVVIEDGAVEAVRS